MSLWFGVMALRRVFDRLQDACIFLWHLCQGEKTEDTDSASASQIDRGITRPRILGDSSAQDDCTERSVEDWRDLIANSGNKWDNRESRRNPRAPDFKHRGTRKALWIDNWQTPAWVRIRFRPR